MLDYRVYRSCAYPPCLLQYFPQEVGGDEEATVVVKPSLGQAGSHQYDRSLTTKEDCAAVIDSVWGLFDGPENCCIVPAPVGDLKEVVKDATSGKWRARVELRPGYRARRHAISVTDDWSASAYVRQKQDGSNYCLIDFVQQRVPGAADPYPSREKNYNEVVFEDLCDDKKSEVRWGCKYFAVVFLSPRHSRLFFPLSVTVLCPFFLLFAYFSLSSLFSFLSSLYSLRRSARGANQHRCDDRAAFLLFFAFHVRMASTLHAALFLHVMASPLWMALNSSRHRRNGVTPSSGARVMPYKFLM